MRRIFWNLCHFCSPRGFRDMIFQNDVRSFETPCIILAENTLAKEYINNFAPHCISPADFSLFTTSCIVIQMPNPRSSRDIILLHQPRSFLIWLKVEWRGDEFCLLSLKSTWNVHRNLAWNELSSVVIFYHPLFSIWQMKRFLDPTATQATWRPNSS
jgi:hypothetical protein